jgi:sortase B
VRINPRRFFEFLFLLMMGMCLTFICLRNIGDRRAGQLYREAALLVDVPHVAEPSPVLLEMSVPDAEAVLDADKEDAPDGINLSGLREANADVVGWIEIPGVLSYPLLQGNDNAYYLTHAWNGEENAAGAVFLDWRADAGLGGFNTLIYGHRMRNETMFGCLKHYKDAAFWNENPSVTIFNEDGIWQYDIYAAYEVGLTAEVYRQVFSSPEEKQDFIQYGLERSVIDTGITPTTGDSIITLSTCSGSGSDTRWVVQAVRKVQSA